MTYLSQLVNEKLKIKTSTQVDKVKKSQYNIHPCLYNASKYIL